MRIVIILVSIKILTGEKRMDKQFKMTRIAALVALAMLLLAHSEDQPAATVLPSVQVSAQKLGESSYTADKARTATPLDMSLRDTPQSVSVVTQQRIEDQGLTTVTDVVNNVIGISVNQYETNRAGFTARGFDITNLIVDGIPTTWEQAGARAKWPARWPCTSAWKWCAAPPA
jgi:outer membrane receptor for ferric coprogen and ferric-rhodotorulic acid